MKLRAKTLATSERSVPRDDIADALSLYSRSRSHGVFQVKAPRDGYGEDERDFQRGFCAVRLLTTRARDFVSSGVDRCGRVLWETERQ